MGEERARRLQHGTDDEGVRGCGPLDVGSSCEMFMKARLIYHARTQQSLCTRADFIALSDTNRDRHRPLCTNRYIVVPRNNSARIYSKKESDRRHCSEKN